MSAQVGLNAKLYFKTGSASTAGTYALVTGATDVKLNADKDVIDRSSRASPFKKHAVGQTDASIEFDILWEVGNAAFDALWTAFTTGAVIAMKCLDGVDAAATGLHADFYVASFPRDEGLNSSVMGSVKLVIANTAFEPVWVAPT